MGYYKTGGFSIRKGFSKSEFLERYKEQSGKKKPEIAYKEYCEFFGVKLSKK